MKLLIAYDGSKCAEAAIDDLIAAGLPDRGQARIISVAEVWMAPPESAVTGDEVNPFLERSVAHYREIGQKALSEAEHLSRHAVDRIRTILPSWQVEPVATYGSPAWEILAAADDFGADLIVVGSHGKSAISRVVLGSISQKVLTEAKCSVRVSRGKINVDATPIRIVVGFDGSRGADAAIDSVASRKWAADTEVNLVSVSNPVMPTSVGRFLPPLTDAVAEMNIAEHELLENLGFTAIGKLQDAGLKALHTILQGNPKHVLVEQAEQWGADCIFVGANAFGSRLERFLIGSTSAAVAARARCSVEAVRRSPANTNKI